MFAYRPLAAALLASAFGVAVTAADSPVKRAILQKFDVPPTGAHECILGTAELAPGASIGRHTHPGVESGYVLEGEVILLVEGEEPRTLRRHESYLVAAGKVHDARNTGRSAAKVVGTWVVEKGKPFSAPAK